MQLVAKQQTHISSEWAAGQLFGLLGAMNGIQYLNPFREKCKLQPKQTNNETNTQTNNQTNTQTKNKQTNKRTNQQTNKQTNIQIMCLKIILTTYMCFKSKVAPKRNGPNTWIYRKHGPDVVGVPKRVIFTSIF